MEKMRAPFKRGTKLDYVGPHFKHQPCKYVAWMGFTRSALIFVKFNCGREVCVHVNDVVPAEKQ